MRVLIAIDGSDCSQRAIDALSSMKFGNNDVFRVVSVLDLYEYGPSYYYDDSDALKGVKKLLDEVSRKLNERFPYTEIMTTILRGFVKKALLEICDQWKPDLVVMGSHGRKGFKKLILGSISNSILLASPYPVLIIKEKNLTGKDHNNVVIAIDDSYHSEAAIEKVIDTKWADEIRFHVVSVAASMSDLYSFDIVSETALEQFAEIRKQVENDVQAVIDRAVEKLSEIFGAERVSGELLCGYLPDEILKVAEKLPAGLIVVGSHGKNFMDRLIIGSVSYSVAAQANCSVEVVKIPEDSEESQRSSQSKDKASVS